MPCQVIAQTLLIGGCRIGQEWPILASLQIQPFVVAQAEYGLTGTVVSSEDAVGETAG